MARTFSFMNYSVNVITLPDVIDGYKIEEFYSHFQNISFLQSWYYIKIKLEQNNGHKLIVCNGENGNILGLVFGEIDKRNYGYLSYLTSRVLLEGTPLIRDNNYEVMDLLLNRLTSEFQNTAIYILVRNYFNTTQYKETFLKHGFKYEDHLNIFVDLTKTEDQLWKEIHQKRRNEVKKAKNNGVYVSVDVDIHSLKVGYNILYNVYKKIGLPLVSYNIFEELFNYSGKNEGLKIFSAYYNNEIIGVMFALCYKSVIYDWYAGAKTEYLNKCPNDLIPWEVMRWAKSKGYSLFDFGGAGKPNVPYGVRDYKMKFGGQLVNYGRYTKILRPYLYKISSRGLVIYRWIKKVI